MLQQTQVRTVIPYWQRWMRELPDLQSLARASSNRVLKLWEGLGYYTRARNLHSAARLLATKYRGQFPRDFNEVLSLPGVGRYTAGAICSIAFNQPAPILDGNVIRVLTRIHGIRDNPRERRISEKLWQLASRLVHEAGSIQRRGERNCSDFNQALMELGALICTPKQPRCSRCPVRKYCIAFRRQCVDRIPHPAQRTASIRRRFIAFILGIDGRYAVRQRSTGAINGGLWEFPNTELAGDCSSIKAAAASVLGPGQIPGARLVRINHSITRYRVTLDVHRIESSASLATPADDVQLLPLSRLGRLAFTGAHRKIVDHLRTTADSGPLQTRASRRKAARPREAPPAEPATRASTTGGGV